VFSALSDNCNSLFVVACEHTNLKWPTLWLKRNTITNPELQHLGMRSHMTQEFQPLDNTVVQINQLGLGQPVNVDPHDYSRSYRNDAALNVDDTTPRK
jgi:hypothetical protein